jgi:hypothetical protein
MTLRSITESLGGLESNCEMPFYCECCDAWGPVLIDDIGDVVCCNCNLVMGHVRTAERGEGRT